MVGPKEAVKALASVFYRHASSSRPDIFIHSTQRSGSTLLFDIAAREPGSKAVGEPFEERKHPVVSRYVTDVRSRYTELDEATASEIRTYIDRMLSGAFVGGFERTYNPRSIRHHRITDHNVVKILRALGCAIWFKNAYPEAKHLLVLRHPAPTVLSRTRNAWAAPLEEFIVHADRFGRLTQPQLRFLRDLSTASLFERHIGVWILEHSFLEWSHEQLREAGIPILAYEHLVTARDTAAAWLTDWLDLSSVTEVSRALGMPSRSTAHSTRETRDAISGHDSEGLLRRWEAELSAGNRTVVEEALGVFSFTGYSVDEPLPQSWIAAPPWNDSA